jgi:hypothetical protein
MIVIPPAIADQFEQFLTPRALLLGHLIGVSLEFSRRLNSPSLSIFAT